MFRIPPKLIAACALIFGVATALAQPLPPTTTLSPEQAAQDVRVLKRALTELHPGLTKYLSEEQWQAALGRFELRGKAARSVTALYLAASELAAAIRCGHTWTNVLNQSGPIKASLLENADKLPFTMTLVAGRWLVLASADTHIKKGDEVIAVDGISAPEMVKMMWPYLRADGNSDSKRLRQLGHDRSDYSQLDITWPLLNPPFAGRYHITVKRGASAVRNLNVHAITLGQRTMALNQQGITAPDESWTLKIDGAIATLTLPTFSFWNSKFDWAAFLSESFAELNARNVPNLVIDIRENEGGDGAIGAKIVANLLTQPYRYESNQSVTMYERVPYAIARYLDTWDYSFFDRTGKVARIVEGPQAGKFEVTSRIFGERVVMPVSVPYRGKVFLLIGGENSSASFQFAWLAQRAGMATLVGQPTGGNMRGLSGGELTWVNLPNSGVAVDIPLLATRYQFDTPDASVTPDVLVARSFVAQKSGKDEEVEAVLALIRNK